MGSISFCRIINKEMIFTFLIKYHRICPKDSAVITYWVSIFTNTIEVEDASISVKNILDVPTSSNVLGSWKSTN